MRLKYLIVAGVALLAVGGWIATFYLLYSSKVAETARERLLKAIDARVKMPFLEIWLGSTILNQEGMEEYWHRDEYLKVSEIKCATILSDSDAILDIAFKGTNISKMRAETCPMILFGGSVVHLPNLPQKAISVDGSGIETELHIREVLDLGQFHLVDMVFPVPLDRRDAFEIAHRHSWPGAMTDGEDTLWYPYAAMFRQEVARLVVSMTFESAPTYVRGVTASLSSGHCETSDVQPSVVVSDSKTYEWIIEPVDNECIYGVIFSRDGQVTAGAQATSP